MNLLKITNIISDIASTNEKIAKFTKIKDDLINQPAIRLLRNLYNPKIVLGVNKKTIEKVVEIDPSSSTPSDDDLLAIFESDKALEKISKLRVPNQEWKDFLADLFSRRLRMGLDIKGINKALVAGKLPQDPIPTPKYMRCSVMDDKTIQNISFPCVAQLKEDSEFVNLYVDGNFNVWLESRNGKETRAPIFTSKLSKAFRKGNVGNIVIHGELLLDIDSKDRAEIRGKISSLTRSSQTLNNLKEKLILEANPLKQQKIQKEIDQRIKEWNEIDDKLYISAWDIVTRSNQQLGIDETPYIQRLKRLREITSKMEGLINPTETWPIRKIEDIEPLAQEVYSRGDEGIIIKDLNMIWKDGTSKQQLKVKEFHTFEMRVVGWNLGEGNFKDGIGSLQVESSDGIIRANISGLSLEQRGLELIDSGNSASGYKRIDNFDPDVYVGRIVEVKANEVSKAKDSDHLSLIFPSLVRFRDDKNIADDSEYVVGLFRRKK